MVRIEELSKIIEVKLKYQRMLLQWDFAKRIWLKSWDFS